MRHGHVLVAGEPHLVRHRLGGDPEGIRAQADSGDAGPLQHDPIGQTGRAARASITDRGDREVAVVQHLLDDGLLDRRAEVALLEHPDLPDAVLLLQLAADGAEDDGAVRLRVVEQADDQALQHLGPRRQRRVGAAVAVSGGVE